MNVNPLINFLTVCENKGLRYVCWKGLHKISDAIHGQADIDIFVPADDMRIFKSCAQDFDWFELVPPVIFDGIFHFYKFSLDGLFYHIHVYTIIRTGASYSKGYEICGIDLISKACTEARGIKILDRQTAAKIHFLRLALRKKSLMGRLFFCIERSKHECEGDWLNVTSDNACWSGFSYRKVGGATKLRAFWNILWRCRARVFGSKKRLSRGVIVAITGPDGAGKSAISVGLENLFREKIDVCHYSFGRPSFFVSSSPFWLLRNISTMIAGFVRSRSSAPLKKEDSGKLGLLKCWYLVFLGVERWMVMKECEKVKRAGRLVILDRCPTTQMNQMDGPKIGSLGGLRGFLGRLEIQMYRSFVLPDLIIRLDLGVEEAKSRNRMRRKWGKESDLEIEARHEMFKAYDPPTLQTVILDASKSYEEVRLLAASSISSFLSRNI